MKKGRGDGNRKGECRGSHSPLFEINCIKLQVTYSIT